MVNSKILSLLVVVLMLAGFASAEGEPSIGLITVDPEAPTCSDNVQICAEIVGAESAGLDYSSSRSSGNSEMTNTEGNTWCTELSAASMSPIDAMVMSYSITATNVNGPATSEEQSYTYSCPTTISNIKVHTTNHPSLAEDFRYPDCSEWVQVCADVTNLPTGTNTIKFNAESFLPGEDVARDEFCFTMFRQGSSNTYCRTMSAHTMSPVDGLDVRFYITAHNQAGEVIATNPNPDEETLEEFTYDCAAPNVCFWEDKHEAKEGEDINFDANYDERCNTYDTVDENLYLCWNFGDSSEEICCYENEEGCSQRAYVYASQCTTEPYVVTLTATDLTGHSADMTAEKMITDVDPIAAFTETLHEFDEGVMVSFNADITQHWDPITQYCWDFGDGTVTCETDPQISHIYQQEGSYTVTLTVYEEDGDQSSAQDYKTVFDTDPIAEFTESTHTPTEGETVVTFTSHSTSWDGIVEYCWNFGDGSEPICGEDLDVITYTYPLQGCYYPTLTIREADGDEDTYQEMDERTENPVCKDVQDAAPTACFTEDTHTPLECSQAVNFDADCTESYDEIYGYQWDFNNDGTIDEECYVTDEEGLDCIETSYTYNDDGAYNVVLKVRDLDDAEWTVSALQTKNVQDDVPEATIAGEEKVVKDVMNTYTADDLTDCDAVSYEWDCNYEDGANWEEGSVTHDCSWTRPEDDCCSASADGEHTVAVRVTDDDGDVSIAYMDVTVFDYMIGGETGLHECWSLISLPLIPEDDDMSIESVLSSIEGKYDVVWSYQNGEWNYFKYANEVINGTETGNVVTEGDLTTMEPGYGYYIKINTAGTKLFLNGKRMHGCEEWSMPKPPVVTLTPSWNLIGHYGTVPTLTKLEALETVGVGHYATMLDIGGYSMSSMHPGEGYWLFQTYTENLDYAPSDAAYPALTP